MTRDLRLLPWGQSRITFPNKVRDPRMQARNFIIEIDAMSRCTLPRRKLLQLLDFSFEVGNGFLEIQVNFHANRCCGRTGLHPVSRHTAHGKIRVGCAGLRALADVLLPQLL